MKIIKPLIIASLLSTSIWAKPEKVEKVFGSSPPMTYLLYALNPSKMIGLNFAPKNANNSADERYLDREFLNLPVIGSFHGGNVAINIESVAAKKPDLTLIWQDDVMVDSVKKEMSKISVPYLMVPFRKIEDMPRSIKLVGDAIGESKRAMLLSTYSQKIIDEIKSSVGDKKVRYYYAQGIDGLSTECSDSFHIEALNFVGGENVHKCQQSGVLGLEQINLEQLLKYNPEVIVVQNRSLYNDIKSDNLWKNLRALKNNRVYLAPITPFNWIDRPPSFMRVLGIQFLASKFHPDSYKIDLNTRIVEFFALFLRKNITKDEASKFYN